MFHCQWMLANLRREVVFPAISLHREILPNNEGCEAQERLPATAAGALCASCEKSHVHAKACLPTTCPKSFAVRVPSGAL